MTTFTCPGCHTTVTARALEVFHPCPKRQHRATRFTPAPQPAHA